MGGVENFMEAVAEDYAALQKENAVLKGKLKVLVEKVEEYRSTEDAMRLALLSAQKMSVQIENDAKAASAKLTQDTEKHCQELRRQAETEARRIINDAQNATALEQSRVDKAKAASGSYIAKVRRLCEEQLRFLDEIAAATSDKLGAAAPAAPAPAPAQDQGVEVETTVKSIEDSVAKLVDGPASRSAEPAARPAGDGENTQLFQAVRPQPPREEGVLRDQMGFESL
jgi:cell division initiation protein